MASYNIAANTRRISPVQEMLQARGQQDAHEINQLNIERAEIEMPYVKQLTEQKVAQGEQDLADSKTRSKYLEKNLSQREEAADLSITAAQDAEKVRQRGMRFDESLSEVMKAGDSPRTLRNAYPIEYAKWAENQAATQLQGIEALTFKMKILDNTPTEAGKAAYWEQAVQEAGIEMPEGLQTYSPEGAAALKKSLREHGNSVTAELLNEIEWYSDPTGGNDPAMAQRLIAKLDQLGSSSVGSTMTERQTAVLWGWTAEHGVPPAAAGARFNEIEGRLRFMSNALLKARLSSSTNERLLFDKLDLQEIKELKGEEAYFEALGASRLDAFESLQGTDPEFYMWAKRGRDAQTMPADMRPDIPPAPTATTEPPAADKPEPVPEPEPPKVGDKFPTPDGGEVEYTGGDPAKSSSYKEVKEVKEPPKDGSLKSIIESEPIKNDDGTLKYPKKENSPLEKVGSWLTRPADEMFD
jgi:hypothetical protein